MKKILFVCFLWVCFFKTKSQTIDTVQAQAYYSFSHARDTMFLEKLATENFVLQLGKNMSVYKTMDQAIADSERNAAMEKARINFESTGQMNISMVGVKTATNTLIYKSILDNKMIFVAPFMKVNYLIEGLLPTISWVVTEETKQLNTLTCQKATTKFRGRNYEAWFCPDLPYNDGPWKFSGLPGLIVEIYDTKKEVIFLLNKIEINKDKTILISYPEKYQKTTPEEYTQLREAVKVNPGAFINGQINTMGGEGNIKVQKISTTGRNLFNNPIELSKD